MLEIGVRNAYARDWLASRLASTVARLLAGMLDHVDVEVRFVISGNQEAGEPEEAEPSAENHEAADVQVFDCAMTRWFSLREWLPFPAILAGSFL